MEQDWLIYKDQIDIYAPRRILSRLGFGAHQIIVMFILSFLFMACGAQFALLASLRGAIQDYFDLSELQLGIACASEAIGFLAGCLICMRIRRKLACIVGSIIVILMTLLCLVVAGLWIDSFTLFAFSRVVIGLGFGIITPACLLLFLDNLPGKYHPFAVSFFIFMTTFGSLLAVVTAGLFLEWEWGDYDNRNWQLSFLVWLGPLVLTLLLLPFFIPEGPEYVVLELNEPQMAVDILEDISKRNNKAPLNDFEKDQLYILQDVKKLFWSYLQNESRMGIPLSVCMILFSTHLLSYGIMFILPEHSDNDQEFRDMMLGYEAQIPLIIILTLSLYNGSSQFLLVFLMSIAIVSSTFAAMHEDSIILFEILTQISCKGVLLICYAYILSLEPVCFRDKMFFIMLILGILGFVICPSFVIWAHEQSKELPFTLLSAQMCMSLLGYLITVNFYSSYNMFDHHPGKK